MAQARARSSCSLIALTVILLAAFTGHAWAVSPADFVSGTIPGENAAASPPRNTTIYTVPAGKTFVLTDLDYSLLWVNQAQVGNRVEGALFLLEGGTVERWSTFVAGFSSIETGNESRDMLSKSFTTGIVFASGTTASLFHSPWQTALPGTSVTWRLSWSGYLVDNSTTGVIPGPPANDLQLGNAAPNPLDESTRIGFSLGKETRITVRVMDARGRLVRTLFDGRSPAGDHGLTWDARDTGGRAVQSGVYFIELVAGNERRAQKAVVIN